MNSHKIHFLKTTFAFASCVAAMFCTAKHVDARELEIVNWGDHNVNFAYVYSKEHYDTWAGGTGISNSTEIVGWITVKPKSSKKIKVPGNTIAIYMRTGGKQVDWSRYPKHRAKYVHPQKAFYVTYFGNHPQYGPNATVTLNNSTSLKVGRDHRHIEDLGFRKVTFRQVPIKVKRLNINR